VSDKVKELNTDNFDEVIGANKIVVVDFWAPWCGPCKAIAPIIDELAEAYGAEVTFAKVNTDSCESIAQAQGIRSLPTIRIFKDGAAATQSVGMATRAAIEDMIDEQL
jgi:thioredoxin 1